MTNITTSQTIGPFSHEAWQWAADLTEKVEGPAVTIRGIIYDGDGAAINDAQIEAWLPDAAAAEAGQGQAMPGFRRVPSFDDGSFILRAPLPSATSSSPSAGEPLMYVTVFARGLVKHQFTAVFLEDDSALAQSAILNQVPAARRATLIARKEADGEYRWDIWMQTDKETVFFDYA
ncbi:MAG: Protocatechuate 3,4-dioxygenase alpha chain [Massilia sp.]|jgi:protocatechuate 3,4-dioxygenase alpha subunit|nr:Protocatechuate 3,4-dioxygenase alpha chain [Massilia sp.]MDB5950128.1 Protocatechuate 3,4-dioxygenase alpha chain [Massilia sp.]